MESKSIKYYIKLLINSFLNKNQKGIYLPRYRIIEIYQTDENEYIAEIQIINKNITFRAKPEEILSNDDLVDQFSPQEVRTLTYLGYLGINSPKYKILAKRLSEKDSKISFALKKKGERKFILKTADEIINQKDIADNLTSKDAQLIGYTLGIESLRNENILLEELKNDKKKIN